MRFPVLTAALLLASSAVAAPLQFSHQGRLFDSTGSALEGSHDLTFALHDTTTGGNAAWEETLTVELEDGFFSVQLGETTDLDASFFDGTTKFLTVAVDAAAPLPGVPVVSVPYALVAGSVSGPVNATEVTVAGETVISSDGTIDYSRISGVPDGTDTLSGLTCQTDQLAVFDGTDWICGGLGTHAHDADDITGGTLDIARLPVGTTAGTVASGEHSHDASHITGGTLDAARLPSSVDFAGAVSAGSLSSGGAVEAASGAFGALSTSGAAAIGGTLTVGGSSADCDDTTAGQVRSTDNGLEVCAADVWQPIYASSAVKLGDLDWAVDYSGSPSDWTRVNPNTAVGFSWGRYSEFVPTGMKLHARLCMTYTDSGDNADKVQMRIKKYNGTDVYYEHEFGNSWSGSGLVHNDCGVWEETSALPCGYGWGQTCQLEVNHTRGRSTTIHHAWMEVAALP